MDFFGFNMIIFYIVLVLCVIIGLHLILLPLSKKRPILLKGVEAAFFFALLITCMTFFIRPYNYILGLIIVLIFLFIKYWIVMGISKNNIIDALNKAILATRANSENTTTGYILDGALRITIYNIGGKMNIVIFKNILYSKKAILTQTVWRKFIQNFFI